MIKNDCEFYNFCYNTHSASDVKYDKSPCSKCVNEVIGEESKICDNCYGCDECNYELIEQL